MVDPGVGSDRRSIIAETVDHHFIITPDNGTLTHLAKFVGLKRVSVIDEASHALPGSQESHTFHGRDIYAYNGAKLASGQITFEDLGKEIEPEQVVMLPLGEVKEGVDQIAGTIDILDIRFGSLWTNIPLATFRRNLVLQLASLFRYRFIITINCVIKTRCRLPGHLPRCGLVSRWFT